MTGKVSNDVIIYGGMKLNPNQILSKNVSIRENGEKVYSVFLKNGMSFYYPEQKNGARIFTGAVRDMSDGERHMDITIYNAEKVVLKGSDKKDYVSLESSENCVIDVSNDKYGELVSSTKGRGNRFILGGTDSVTLYENEKMNKKYPENVGFGDGYNFYGSKDKIVRD
ncbi:MAG: hypothetical protein LBK53_07250 [Heliobacteriaceae bacterium]|jgi:hypothetical protein|nr:hypothetical protein [Heliobacteriaceae bacterium]